MFGQREYEEDSSSSSSEKQFGNREFEESSSSSDYEEEIQGKVTQESLKSEPKLLDEQKGNSTSSQMRLKMQEMQKKLWRHSEKAFESPKSLNHTNTGVPLSEQFYSGIILNDKEPKLRNSFEPNLKDWESETLPKPIQAEVQVIKETPEETKQEAPLISKPLKKLEFQTESIKIEAPIKKIEVDPITETEEKKTEPEQTIKEEIKTEEIKKTLKELINEELIDKSSFLTRSVMKGFTIQCTIKRDKSGFNRLFPKYFMYLSNGETFLLSAKKRAGNKTSNYVITKSEKDFSKKTKQVIGKVRSNFYGSEFKVYDSGLNPTKKSANFDNARAELALVLYVRNKQGDEVKKEKHDRKICVVLPEVNDRDSEVIKTFGVGLSRTLQD